MYKDQSCSFFILSSKIWQVKILIQSEKCKVEVLHSYIWKLEDSRLLWIICISIWKLLYKVSYNFIGFVVHNWFGSLLWRKASVTNKWCQVSRWNLQQLNFISINQFKNLNDFPNKNFASSRMYRNRYERNFTKSFLQHVIKQNTMKQKFKYHHKM